MIESPDHAPQIVWIAGVGWDDTPGTDRRLVDALAARRDVLWVDSPRRRDWGVWARNGGVAVDRVAPRVERVRVPAVPGASYWAARGAARSVHRWSTRRAARARSVGPVVVANPVHGFPAFAGGSRVLFVTDDWVAGADLLGLSRPWVRARLRHHVQQADAVVAVTPALLQRVLDLGRGGEKVTAVIPNGAPTVPHAPGTVREDVAGVVGQLNQRLDLEALERVADAGVRLRLIGPRANAAPSFADRLDAFIARDGVEWTGSLGQGALATELSRIAVGLTPYVDTDFNRASFPLKTLEYLAAGVPVVSSDLSASRWLDTRHVHVADSSTAFVAAVHAALRLPRSAALAAERRSFAAAHSWQHRAAEFIGLLDETDRAR